MKQLLKSAGLPIGVFALAIGSAFATNAINSSKTLNTPEAYIQNNSEYSCIKKDELCSTVNSGTFCMWEEALGLEHQLYTIDENSTSCTIPLYRVNP